MVFRPKFWYRASATETIWKLLSGVAPMDTVCSGRQEQIPICLTCSFPARNSHRKTPAGMTLGSLCSRFLFCPFLQSPQADCWKSFGWNQEEGSTKAFFLQKPLLTDFALQSLSELASESESSPASGAQLSQAVLSGKL